MSPAMMEPNHSLIESLDEGLIALPFGPLPLAQPMGMHASTTSYITAF